MKESVIDQFSRARESHKHRGKILFFCPDTEKAKTLQRETHAYRIDSTICRTMQEALEKVQTTNYDVIYASYPMEDIDPFLHELQIKEEKPELIFYLKKPNLRQVVEAMRRGAFDCVEEDSSIEVLLDSLHAALEKSRLQNIEKSIERNRRIKLKEELDWNSYRKEIVRRDFSRQDGHLISSIRTSLSQGSGFGSLLSAIALLKRKAKNNGIHYEVPSGLVEILLSNAESARKIIDFFEEIEYIINNPQEKSNFSVSFVHSLFQDSVKSVQAFANQRSIRIKLCEDKFKGIGRFVKLHPQSFRKAIEELLLNALKFSEPNSSVYILFELSKEKLRISMLNSPRPETEMRSGIPREFTEFIFQPFVRLSKIVHEDVPTLDFGLGLTLVEKIISNHGGSIKIGNVESYINSEYNNILINIEME
ncbi:GHKL domain protein, partial [Leptospira inadai serovar Lyme str. 10]